MREKERDKEKAFKELFEANYSKMYYAALFVVSNTDIARDMVNDVLAKLWENFDSCSNEYTPAYLFKITRNRCFDYLRHLNVENQYAKLYMDLYKSGIIDDESHDERMDIIYRVMNEMPTRTRFVVDQCYFEGKKYAEVAEILGISKDGVRKHIIKALTLLRSAFSVNYKKGQVPKNGY